ncbi:MAG: nuclear transport factor 2 family protein [Thermoplasmata archaeon]
MSTIPASRNEHPSVNAVRRLYDAFARNDEREIKDCFVHDAVWHLPGRSLIAGDHQGLDAVLKFLRKLRELSGGTFRAELTDVMANDRYAVALQHATGTRGAKRLDVTACQVMRIHEGRIAEVRGYYSDQYALDDFWS